MASYFGEIIEPDSRCFVSDGSEYFVENKYSVETEQHSTHSEKTYDYLFISCGKVLSDFALSYLVSDNAKIIEHHKIISKPDENGISTGEKITTTLYQVSTNTLLFVCENLPHLYLANTILQKLKPSMELAKHTIVLTSEHMINFKPRISYETFIRSLHTSACKLDVNAPNLELPNTISGLAASIMSWCQAHKKSALIYIVYIDSSHLDSLVAQPLLQLMKSTKFMTSLLSSNPKPLLNIVSKAELHSSNLYL